MAPFFVVLRKVVATALAPFGYCLGGLKKTLFLHFRALPSTAEFHPYQSRSMYLEVHELPCRQLFVHLFVCCFQFHTSPALLASSRFPWCWWLVGWHMKSARGLRCSRKQDTRIIAVRWRAQRLEELAHTCQVVVASAAPRQVSAHAYVR